MEITVLKCDRCKKEVEGLVEFSFINRNIKLNVETDESRDGIYSMNMMFGSNRSNYPQVQGGLCLECVMEISRWLGHQENVLTG